MPKLKNKPPGETLGAPSGSASSDDIEKICRSMGDPNDPNDWACRAANVIARQKIALEYATGELTKGWTRSADELPDSDCTVLGYSPEWPSDPVWPCYHNGEEWCAIEGYLMTDEAGELAPPSHWRHFPEPPVIPQNTKISDRVSETKTGGPL